ncbi:MAG: hypothetical protein ABI609_00685 [Acidobacteriota bacterium]
MRDRLIRWHFGASEEADLDVFDDAGGLEEPVRAALIVAHPGHELMVHAWMERQRPIYCCLTDGSGGNAASRLDSTIRLLDSLGSARGPVFGPYPDKEIYRYLLDGRLEVFVELAEQLADAMIEAGTNWVAGDAAEGFNPTHDVCRFVIDGAVALVHRRTGRSLRNSDFALDARPEDCPEPLRNGALWLRLDDTAIGRKIAAAREYPELRDEVDAALARYGRSAYALECLRPSRTSFFLERFEMEPPAYERFGAKRVEQGRYRELIRYRQHVLPVHAALGTACQE